MKEWIAGRNPVYECLRANRRHFFRLQIAAGVKKTGRIQDILDLAKRLKISVDWVERQEINKLIKNHQGTVLEASGYPYVPIEEVFSKASSLNEPLFILILDQIQDPQNFGTLIRSAEQFGVQGILIPQHRAAGITNSVVNASSGATEHMLIAQGNLAQAITLIQERNGWVIGMDMEPSSTPIDQVDWQGNLALVIGSEGNGLRRLVREKCDVVTHIPMQGRLDSLNAAVAGSIALFTAYQHRSSQKNG